MKLAATALRADGFYQRVEVFIFTMTSLDLMLVIGTVFGAAGAGCAYLITLNEWMHHYHSMKIPRRMALQNAVVAFVFFAVIAIIVGLFL